MQKERYKSLVVPVVSVLLGLILGGIIMLAFSYNPIAGYSALLKGSFGNAFYIGETFRGATPLILVALGFSVARNAGFFNIGVAGQFIIGWLGSIATAMFFPDLPAIVLLPLSVIAGALSGAVWAGIAGFVRAYFGTSEVIATIMLNYTALHASNHIVRNILTESSDSTPKISANASLRLAPLTEITNYSTIHMGIFIALAFLIVIWVLMNKTTVGFEFKVLGFNPSAADYAGMSAKKNIIMAMCVSGALAGLAGSMQGLGTFENIFVMSSVPQTGFDGMAVALLGNGTPIGILLSGILFGALKVGGVSMPLLSGVPSEIVDIVIASIIFFVGANYLINYFISKREYKNEMKLAKSRKNLNVKGEDV